MRLDILSSTHPYVRLNLCNTYGLLLHCQRQFCASLLRL